jgi:MFS family permease
MLPKVMPKQESAFVAWQSRPYLLLTAILFANFAASGLTKPLFSIRARTLGAGLWHIGLIGMVGQIAAALVQYLWGHQSDRLMRRKPLVWLGIAGVAASTLSIGLIRNYWLLFIIQAVASLSSAAYNVGSLALIGDLLEDVPRRGQWMGLHRGIGSLAFGLAAFFGGSIADAYGSAVPFLVGGGFAGLGVLLAWWLREAPATGHASERIDDEAAVQDISLVLLGRIVPFLLLVFVWVFAFNSAFIFWPVYMEDQGFSPTVITRLWGLAALGETVAMVVAGQLCDRWGSRVVLAGGMVGMGLVFVSYTLQPPLWGLVGVQLFRSLAFSAYSASAMLYATMMGLRGQRGRMAGLQATASSLGGITGAATGGGLAEMWGLTPMIRAVGILMAAMGLVGYATVTDPAQAREIATVDR